jgi:uncharacterized protein with HEPN domain
LKDDRLYLFHIAESLERVEEYATDGRDAFLRDRKTQDAILRNLQIMAESTQRLSDELKATHSEIDWRGIAGLRNVLVHDYLGVNVERVWDLVEKEVPLLRLAIRKSLEG